MKSPLGLIFCSNMLMESLQGQLKMVSLRSFFIELFEYNCSKKHSVSHNRVKKSLIGLIFCRNMLMDSLQGQLKTGLAEVIFHGVI